VLAQQSSRIVSEFLSELCVTIPHMDAERIDIDEITAAVKVRWTEQRLKIWKRAPRHLYHYTSGVGLHGILTEHALRGGNYAFMNDRTEIEYGKDLLRDVLVQYGNNTLPAWRDWLNDCSRSSLLENLELYFISFCQKPDLLSQWRGYGGSDTRYCLRFDTNKFKIGPSFAHRPHAIIYKRDRQLQILRDIVDIHLGAYAQAQQNWDASADQKAKRCLLVCASTALIYFKDPTFAEEREWRCIAYLTENPEHEAIFVNSRGVMKPFRVLLKGSKRSELLPLSEVIAGSHSVERHAKRSAELMLKAFGYPAVPVNVSRIPIVT